MINPIEKSIFLVKDKKLKVENADTVTSVEEAKVYLRSNYESLGEVIVAEEYELAGQIRDQLKIVWEKFKNQITDLIYEADTGKLIEVISNKNNELEFINHEDFISKKEKIFWEDKEKVEKSEWSQVLLSEYPDAAVNLFEEETGLLKKVVSLNNYSGNHIKAEKVDLLIEAKNCLHEFEVLNKLANDKLRSVWEFSCLSAGQPVSQYQNQLSYFTDIEFDMNDKYFLILKNETLLSLQYWQTISDNTEIVLRRLNKIKNLLE